MAPLAVAVLLTGCTQAPPAPETIDEAIAHYGAMATELDRAFNFHFGLIGSSSSAMLLPLQSGGCHYSSGNYTSHGPPLLGVDVPIDEVIDVVDDVVEPYGWEITKTELPGGFVGLQAEGPSEGKLVVATRDGVTEYRVGGDVEETCEERRLPAPDASDG